MRYFISLFLFFTYMQSFSFTLTAAIEESASGGVQRAFHLQCSPSESICQNLCSENTCLLNYESCEGCASSTHLKLVSVFQNLSQFYIVNKAPISPDQLVTAIKLHRLAALDADSIFNLLSDAFEDAESGKTQEEFLRLCPSSSTEAFVLANSHFIPEILICQNSYGAAAFQIKTNPQFYRK